jgi:phenylalanine-4-hydroxylase
MSPRDLRAYDIYEGEQVTLEFEGNIKVVGEIVTGTRNLQGEILLIKFKNCTVTHNDTILFQPEWGIYDMAVGKKVIAAFSGPADVNSFEMINNISSSKTIKKKKSVKREELEKLYLSVRNIRQGKPTSTTLKEAFESVSSKHTNDWLLSIEIAELAKKEGNSDLVDKVINHLEKVKINRPEIMHLINNGLELIFEKTNA